jgi:FdhD protein
METITRKRNIIRYHDNGRKVELEDLVIDEKRLKIILDGRDFVSVVVYPSLLEEFILGFFVTRRIISEPADIVSIEIDDGEARVERIPKLREEWPSLDLLETTGSRNIDITGAVIQLETEDVNRLKVLDSTIRRGVKMLAEMPVFKCTGGTHCAILFNNDGNEVASSEDIGRHNSVDKVIGGGIKKATKFSQCWLAVSGRLPADMVIKPALVGIPIIASVSAPTAAGVDTAERVGMTLIGFTRDGRFNCYTHPDRIEQDS